MYSVRLRATYRYRFTLSACCGVFRLRIHCMGREGDKFAYEETLGSFVFRGPLIRYDDIEISCLLVDL